ncbi:hypothetical protein PFISCL1PPCAC_14988, partial [Pristionchus fissidentatus]
WARRDSEMDLGHHVKKMEHGKAPKANQYFVLEELKYEMPQEKIPLREPPKITIEQHEDEEDEDEEVDIDELGEDDPLPPRKDSKKNRKDSGHLKVNSRRLKKSPSLTSLTSYMKDINERIRRLKNNQIAGVVFFLIVGLLCSVASYLMSVYSAQLNKELIETTVTNQETLTKKLKKSLVEGPSKYLVGALNFGGRMLSSIGTVMLVQVIVTYVKRRRYNLVLRSAAGEADQVVGEVHTGVTDAAGELIMNCVQ